MKTAKRIRIAALVAALVLGTPLAASAASVNVDLNTGTAGVQASADAQPGGTVTATMNFVGDGTVTNVSGVLNYPFAQVTATTTAAAGTLCSADNVTGRVAFSTTSGSGTGLADQALCNVTFTVGAGVVPPTTATLTYTIQEFADGTGTTAGGTINIVSGPQPEVDAVPAPGARIVDDIIGGAATNDVITISNAGAAGSTLTLSVAETADPSAVFTGVLASASVANGANTTLTVGCTATAAGPYTATYTVTTNDADEATLVYTYTCNGTTGPAPEVNAVPAPGAQVISDTVGGGATNNVITISNIGTAALTLSVAETGDASSVFTGTLGSASVAAGANTTLTVGCTATAAGPYTATYTVTTNDSDEPTLVYTYTCTGVVAPEFSSVPAAGGSIGLLGAPGAVLNGSVTLQNVGTANLTVASCVGAGGFTVTSPTFPATITPAGSATVNFSCTAPAAAGGSIQGTLTCSGINDTDEPTATYTLLCASQVLAVPTMTLGGKALLASLLAGLGLLGFALRRKFA